MDERFKQTEQRDLELLKKLVLEPIPQELIDHAQRLESQNVGSKREIFFRLVRLLMESIPGCDNFALYQHYRKEMRTAPSKSLKFYRLRYNVSENCPLDYLAAVVYLASKQVFLEKPRYVDINEL